MPLCEMPHHKGKKMNENALAEKVIGTAIEVHRELGPGLLESVYERILYYELTQIGLNVQRQVTIPIRYKSINISEAFRADLIIENKIILELKSVSEFHSVHYKQLLTYLKLTNKKLGLLINFNVDLLKHGIKRIINGKL